MTNYERGRQYEYKSIRILEAAGYTCVRAAGSKGPFDIVGSCTHGTCYVQVKFGYRPSPAELELLELAMVPQNALKLVHVWRKGESWPRVLTLHRGQWLGNSAETEREVTMDKC